MELRFLALLKDLLEAQEGQREQREQPKEQPKGLQKERRKALIGDHQVKDLVRKLLQRDRGFVLLKAVLLALRHLRVFPKALAKVLQEEPHGTKVAQRVLLREVKTSVSQLPAQEALTKTKETKEPDLKDSELRASALRVPDTSWDILSQTN